MAETIVRPPNQPPLPGDLTPPTDLNPPSGTDKTTAVVRPPGSTPPGPITDLRGGGDVPDSGGHLASGTPQPGAGQPGASGQPVDPATANANGIINAAANQGPVAGPAPVNTNPEGINAGAIKPGDQTPDNMNPVTGEVTSNQTVQGQLGELLKNGNPLLEAAKARAMQTANARGLANSSMASQSGEEAMVNSALPIAQQDAATYQKQALVNQDVKNQFASMRLGAGLDLNKQYEAFLQQGVLQDKDNALKKYINDSGISSNEKIAAMQAAVNMSAQANQLKIASDQLASNLKIAGMNIDAQKFLTTYQVDANTAMNMANLKGNQLSNLMNTIATIQSSQMEPEAKTAAIKNILSMAAGNPYLPINIDVDKLLSTSGLPTTGGGGGGQ